LGLCWGNIAPPPEVVIILFPKDKTQYPESATLFVLYNYSLMPQHYLLKLEYYISENL
jgi:hypothetical protein